jgi:hypothetical protein
MGFPPLRVHPELPMTPTPGRIVAAAASIAFALSLAGCGGGGGGDAGPGPTPTTSLSGNVVKGPTSGATVTAYSIAGGMMGSPLGTAVTDPQGAFAMPMASAAGPVMLQIAGGTYTDEATGAKVTFAPGQVMTAVLSSLASGTASVQVTPLTAMAQAMAAGMPGGMTPANIDAANAAVGAYFMIGDIVHTRPVNPLVSGSGVGAAMPMANYGIALGAMAQYAKNAGVSSSAFVGSMMQDAADGVLDGKAGTTPIAMGPGMMGGGAMMQASAGGSGLAAAMADFMNSPANASGLTAASMTQLMQQLAAGTGRLR